MKTALRKICRYTVVVSNCEDIHFAHLKPSADADNK